MNAYAILTDSCHDLPVEMISGLDVRVASLSVQYDENTTFADGSMDPREFYAGVRGGKMPQTAAVNPDQWGKLMEAELKAGRDVLVLSFSSGISATYQSAVIAADEMSEKYPDRKILVVDTLTGSVAQGMLVWHVSQLRRNGATIDEAYEWAVKMVPHTTIWLTVNDLMHLKRGGRLSATTAIVGTMLQVKPVLKLDDEGRLQSDSKARGRKAAMNMLVEKLEKQGLPGENETVFVGHGDCMDDAQTLAQMLKDRCGVKNVVISYVGNVIGSHTGPDVLVLAFLSDHR